VNPTDSQGDLLAVLAHLWDQVPAGIHRLAGLSPWALAGIALAGLFLLVAGARWRRPLSAAGGALVGWLGGLVAARALGLTGGLFPVFWAAALGAGSALLPPLYPFAGGALLGALAGAWLPVPGRGIAAAAVLLILLAGLSLLAARGVLAATAGLLGAGLVGAALAGAGHRVPALAPLSAHPALLAGLVLVLAIAGAAFQARGAGTGRWPRVRAKPPPADGSSA
jgi:hypothetical protein